MTMLKKKFLAAVLTSGAMATSATAATVNGFSDFTDNGGGSFTFTFDTVTADIKGTGDGLFFTNGMGLDFLATGSNGGVSANMIQDFPADGGLGVDEGPSGDNMGAGESIALVFNQAVNFVNWTLNDGHTDAASGNYSLTTSKLGFIAVEDSADWDGVGAEDYLSSNVCELVTSGSFCNVDNIMFIGRDQGNPADFTGYLESITVQVSAVPLPAGAWLLLSGLGGIAALKRRKKRTA